MDQNTPPVDWIRVICPLCSVEIEIDSACIGRKVKCSECRAIFVAQLDQSTSFGSIKPKTGSSASDVSPEFTPPLSEAHAPSAMGFNELYFIYAAIGITIVVLLLIFIGANSSPKDTRPRSVVNSKSQAPTPPPCFPSPPLVKMFVSETSDGRSQRLLN